MGKKLTVIFMRKFYTMSMVFPWEKIGPGVILSKGGDSKPGPSFRGKGLTRARFSGWKVYAGGGGGGSMRQHRFSSKIITIFNVLILSHPFMYIDIVVTGQRLRLHVHQYSV